MIKKIVIFFLAIVIVVILKAEAIEGKSSDSYEYNLEISDSLNKIDPILNIFGYDHNKMPIKEEEKGDSIYQENKVDSIYNEKFNEIKKSRDALFQFWGRLTLGCLGSTLAYAVILGIVMWTSSIGN